MTSPFPHDRLQLLQPDQDDQVPLNKLIQQTILRNRSEPGQTLLLHCLSSILCPKQLEPGRQDRCLSDLPPPQVIVQPVQDSQDDHFVSAAAVYKCLATNIIRLKELLF